MFDSSYDSSDLSDLSESSEYMVDASLFFNEQNKKKVVKKKIIYIINNNKNMKLNSNVKLNEPTINIKHVINSYNSVMNNIVDFVDPSIDYDDLVLDTYEYPASNELLGFIDKLKNNSTELYDIAISIDSNQI